MVSLPKDRRLELKHFFFFEIATAILCKQYKLNVYLPSFVATLKRLILKSEFFD